jgi:GntP family gluconate:H+ symporter
MGLYATHCLVPPTPGPIAVAGELHAELGTVILLGLVVVIPVVVATCAYAIFIGKRLHIAPVAQEESPAQPGSPAGLSATAAFSPVVLPVLLIALKSAAEFPGSPLAAAKPVLSFLGDSNTALVLGVLLAAFVVRQHGRDVFGLWCGDGLKDAGTIILITAAGGALGGVLRETALPRLVGDALAAHDFGRFNILLPFVIAAGLKTALGSSTVAMITTASLVAPLLASMGLGEGAGPALATLAIASGAMMVSHVNDSYFWVITQMSGLTVTQGYRLVTVASGIAGLAAISTVLLLSLFLL